MHQLTPPPSHPLSNQFIAVTSKESLETEAHGLKFGAAAMQVID